MIIHLIGPMCVGKTYLCRRLFYNNIDLVFWDIKDNFYKPLEILENSKLNIDLYNKYKDKIGFIIDLFIRQHKDKDIIIESSGTNKQINKQLKNYKVYPVFIKQPEKDIYHLNIKNRGEDINRIWKFNKHYYSKIIPIIKHFGYRELSIEEAYNYINQLLNGDKNE